MHSFHQSRGRIFFEACCVLTMAACFAVAWLQTFASAFLPAAAVAALYGIVRAADLRRRPAPVLAERVPVEAPAADEPAVPVVVDDGEVFARSWLGDRGVWYRHVRARPQVILHVAGRSVAARAVSATDDDSVERTSRGFEKKYAGDMSTPAMVVPKIFHTTIRFEPR